jgi:hypothetical protein
MDFHRAREAIDIGRAHVDRMGPQLDELVARLGCREPAA